MGKWDMVRLGDVFPYIRNGASIQQGKNPHGYPITRIETISDGLVNRNKMGYAGIEEIESYTSYILQDGDILMSHINSVSHLGKVARYSQQDNERIIHGMNLLNLRADVGKIMSLFAYYFFTSYAFKKQLPSITKNSVNQSSFNITALKELQMPLPPLAVQEKIADVLDRAAALIQKRKTQIEKLDLLVKAKFVTMFGDPVSNSKNLSTTRFENVVKLQRGYDLPVQSRNTQGSIPVYGSNGILGSHDTAMVSGGGVITGRSGTLGKVHYTLNDYWPLNTTLFSVNLNGNNIIYLAYLLELFRLERFTEGSGVPTLNRNIVHKEEIIDIPIYLQKRFADFVLAVNKSKSKMQNGLDKLELLYKSLIQKCFADEVF
jgi:type I restriction enzyme S subunit